MACNAHRIFEKHAMIIVIFALGFFLDRGIFEASSDFFIIILMLYGT
jgi:hypothetical protein